MGDAPAVSVEKRNSTKFRLRNLRVMKIRAHLALIATAALIPMMVFSAVALDLLLEAERKAALKSLHEAARSTTLILDRELGSAEAGLRVLAHSERLASNDLAGFYIQAKAAHPDQGTWAVLLDARGQQLINTSRPFGSSLPLARGNVTAPLATGQTVVSDLQSGPAPDGYFVTISLPVSTPSGQRYVLAQAFSPAYFVKIFAQNSIPSDWTVAVLDRTGRFIARNLSPGKMLGSPARPELTAALLRAPDGELHHKTWEGINVYDVFTHSDFSGWTVAVAVPEETIESAARRAVLVAALGLLAAALAAAATAALVSRRLIASIRGVDAAAAALTRGDIPTPVHTGVDEMDTLANAFTRAGNVLMHEKQSRMEVEAERACLLENERVARKDAEQQNRAKDQFLAMLGHELRNPLSAISGAIAVMKARDASAALNTRAHTIIERQSNHLSHIVDDLLDLSRMSMGKISLDKQPVDLAAVVYAAVDALYAAARVGQCDIGIEAEPAWIDADRIRLDQIIDNVVGNALKFSSFKGRIDITVGSEPGTSDRPGEAVWTVRDFGIGISEDLMPNIFDAFVQGAAQADHALGGLGIGLNLVRQLVALHGGSIDVLSAGPGTGTTVVVRFPLSHMAGTAAATHAAAALHVPLAGMSTVLLIEDNADSREMMAMLLGMLGYQVLEAANGIDGLRLAQQERPAIAVVDIGLPDMDGYAVARKIRALPVLQNMTLIALTGYGQEADRQRAMAAGFDSHLVKPLDMDVLVKTIVSHQAKQKAHSQDSGAGR